jgi:hypothetical protein
MSRFAHTAGRIPNWLSAKRRQLHRIGLAIAAFWFACGLVWAVWTFPESTKLNLWPLAVLLLAGVPVMAILNATEFQIMSRIAGMRTGWSAAFDTTIYASAANMLPIPGGAIARVVALKAGGATFGTGSMVTILFAGIWGGTAFGYSGIWLWILSHSALGTIFGAAGTGMLAMCVFAGVRLQAPIPLLARAVAVRAASLLVEILRHMLAFHALGAMVGFGEASIFAVSSFVGSAVSIVPAGLGVRELVVTTLSPLIALPPAVGFLSVTINRVLDMIGLAAISAALFICKRDTS